MFPDSINAEAMALMRSVSSNLIRAQQEEILTKDITKRDSYLDKASSESVQLAQYLLDIGDNKLSSEYFLSAAYSYKKSEAYHQSKACFDKVVEIGEDDFLEEAREGLRKLNNIRDFEWDLVSKNGRINALHYLIWNNYGLTTTKAVELFKDEFDQDISSGTVRSYAKILKQRKRVIIWGGPQGREYHIYPDVANLATRKRYYGRELLFEGAIEERITERFEIDFSTLNFNKEIFILNGNIKPKMMMTIDMDAFVKNIYRFSAPGFNVKALGKLESFSDLARNGYKGMSYVPANVPDVLDSNKIFEGNTGEEIHIRAL